MRGWRGGVQKKRVHKDKDDVPGRCNILHDLKRNSVHLFDPFVEPRNTHVRSTTCTKIADIRMRPRDFRSCAAFDPGGTWLSENTLVNKSVRSAEDIHAAATRLDVSQHRVDFHTARR